MPGQSAQFIVSISLIIFSAAFLQSFSGFGFSLVAVPLITLQLQPRIAIPLLIVYSVLINLTVLLSTARHFRLRDVWLLFPSGLAGLPLGTYLLLNLNDNLLKLLIGVFIVLFGSLFLVNFSSIAATKKPIQITAGFISGILCSSISLSGPPIILFLTNKHVGKNYFRSTLAAYFLFLNLITVILYLKTGLLDREITDLIPKFLPALVAGIAVGAVIAQKVKEVRFRHFVIILLLITGVFLIISALNRIL
ncbi:MAG: sulfite exporter TauE/SafE family protein [Candidatus Cloacimonetes bacterium]|nr:sulfite exporter TauE/SafE family protein [Candidatus Cloacimonadota bacterium]